MLLYSVLWDMVIINGICVLWDMVMYQQMKVCALGYGDVSTNEGMCFGIL